METEFQLLTMETTDRAGAITAVAASLASRGVNIECFLATECDQEAGRRRGSFVVVIEADRAYASVLRKALRCLDVVHHVSEPTSLLPAQLARWKSRFSRLSSDCRAAGEASTARSGGKRK